MKNFLNIVGLTVLVLGLVACSGVPNNITMTVNQGYCVQESYYQNLSTPILAIESNPLTAPYCASVTIQNNNSGSNANNVQIISSGLTASYTVGTTVYSATLFDSVAAGSNTSPSTPSAQNIGNIAFYDPNNCATTAGINIKVLNSGGNTCTYYLQIIAESYPVNVYPITLTWNYTNGNQNFVTSTNVNQRVYLYGGTSIGLYYNSSTESAISQPQWQSVSGAPNGSVSSIVADQFGNVYFASGNKVYIYNGNPYTPATQLGSPIPTLGVTSLALDVNGNLYAGTDNKNGTGDGVFVFSKNESIPDWVRFNDHIGNLDNQSIIGLLGFKYPNGESTTLYAITSPASESGGLLYYCKISEIIGHGCLWRSISKPINTPFIQNALAVDLSNNIYLGFSQSAYSISASYDNWTPYNFTNAITGVVSGVAVLGDGNENNIVFGEESQVNLSTESAAYICTNLGSVCNPLLSTTENNSITGNIYTVTSDGAGNVYVGGGTLFSADFEGIESGPVAGAYLLMNNLTPVESTVWQPINNGDLNSNIRALLVSSMLTSY